MDHRTEAACLLETGALYRERVGLIPSADPGGLIFAGFKHGAFSLYFGDEPIYHFDREGRWQRAFLGGRHFLRGLDGEVHAIDRPREGANMVLLRRKLNVGEVRELDQRIRQMAVELRNEIETGRCLRREPPDGLARPLGNGELVEFLARVGRWDSGTWNLLSCRYRTLYDLPFLPPECQDAVVVQATIEPGSGRSFGVARTEGRVWTRNSDGFERHVREVAEIWGERVLQARLVYLADRGVLRRPASQVNQFLEAIGRTFPIGAKSKPGQARLDGVHLFLDNFHGVSIDPEEWRGFIDRGAIRLSLGVESGASEVRSIYQKAWSDDELRATVAAAKAAGLGISVLTLVGAGGVGRVEEHIEATVRLLLSLELNRGDFVFLLDEKELGENRTDESALELLQGAAWSDQQSRLKKALEPLRARAIKVLPYTMAKQWM